MDTTPPVQPNELIPPIAIEILPSTTDGNLNSAWIVELTKTVWHSTTAVQLVSFTEEGVVSFTDGMDVDRTVVLISRSVQFKVNTCIVKYKINTALKCMNV